MKLLSGLTVLVGRASKTGPQQFRPVVAAGSRQPRPAAYLLLALRYPGQALSLYPKTTSETYTRASDLAWMVGHTMEERVWPGSDLVRYASAGDKIQVLASDAALDGRSVNLALIRPMLDDHLDAVVEVPPGISDDELMHSVIALLQGLMALLGEPAISLHDSSLRYLRACDDKATDCIATAAARNLANRAFHEAGGDAA